MKMLPMWASSSAASPSLGEWSQLSLHPYFTRASFVLFLAHGMLFLVVMQRIDQLEDIERLLKWTALAGGGMAVIGLLQFMSGNGKFLGFYEHPYRTANSAVKGTFSNENHFGQFLALAIVAMIWWAYRLHIASPGKQRRRAFDAGGWGGETDDVGAGQSLKLSLAGMIAVAAFAGLLTFSRGAVIVILFATAVCAGLYVWRGLIGKRALVAVTGVGVLVGAALSIHGMRPLAAELETIDVTSIDKLDKRGLRRKLWTADLQAWKDFPLLGVGAGSHVEAYRSYYPHYSHVEFTHAESGYVQVLMETGVAGFSLLLAGLGMLAYWAIRAWRNASARRETAIAGALVAGLAASALHSIWDFVWYLPACLSVALIFAACLIRLAQLVAASSAAPSVERPAVWGRWAWPPALLAVGALVLMMLHEAAPAALAQGPWERYLAIDSINDEHQAVNLSDRIYELEETVRRHPNHARANLRLATLYLQQFEQQQASSANALGLAQIRQAAVASKFESRETLYGWLDVAVGENRRLLDRSLASAFRAAKLCPLQGRAYLLLGELGFLVDQRGELHAACINQAQRVRPYDGMVLFALGARLAADGDIETALELWHQAFHHDPGVRRQIVNALIQKVQAEEIIDRFQPGRESLGEMYLKYVEMQMEDQARIAAVPYAAQLEQAGEEGEGRAGASYWIKAHQIHQYLGDADASARCLRCAVAMAPDDVEIRQRTAAELINNEQFDEAVEQLRWCLRRKPGDSRLTTLLKRAHDGRLGRLSPPRTAQPQSAGVHR